MVRNERERTRAVEKPPGRAWLLGAIGWLIPGAGHLLQGKWGRGLLLSSTVWVCFIAGLLMGGHMFSLNGSDQGSSVLLPISGLAFSTWGRG